MTATTTTTQQVASGPGLRGEVRPQPLSGTGTMLRFMLRRDRIRFPAWVLGLSLMLAYFANALGLLLDDEALETFATFSANPVMALIGGPGYGFDDITLGRFLVGVYGAFIMIGAALMGIMTITRHTRVEEQTGRAEMVRANVVGRHAQLAAALILALIMSATMAALMTLTFHSSPAAGSLNASVLFACSIAAVALVFAGVAAVTVQLSPYSRAASGMAGAVLAVSYMVRGLGDMSFVQGGDLGWLSWLSPLGWSQQTAPLTLDRWWPLTISVGTALLLAAAGFALQSHRDLEAGILPDRLGAAEAPAWLRGSLSLAFRLQRTGLGWWSFALLLGGITFGAFVQPMAENAEGMPEEFLAIFGGAEGMVEGYLGFMGVYMAIMAAVFALLSVQALRGEEQGVRTEPVLAAAVSRSAWLLSWTLVTALGALWLLALAGLGNAIGAGLATGDWALFGDVVLGHVAHAPAIWALLGFAVALYGLAPRLTGLSWAVFGYSAALSLFGDVLQLDEAVLATSVFRHIGQYPAQEISWGAAGWLTAIGVLLVVVGVARFNRRDLITA